MDLLVLIVNYVMIVLLRPTESPSSTSWTPFHFKLIKKCFLKVKNICSHKQVEPRAAGIKTVLTQEVKGQTSCAGCVTCCDTANSAGCAASVLRLCCVCTATVLRLYCDGPIVFTGDQLDRTGDILSRQQEETGSHLCGCTCVKIQLHDKCIRWLRWESDCAAAQTHPGVTPGLCEE